MSSGLNCSRLLGLGGRGEGVGQWMKTVKTQKGQGWVTAWLWGLR